MLLSGKVADCVFDVGAYELHLADGWHGADIRYYILVCCDSSFRPTVLRCLLLRTPRMTYVLSVGKAKNTYIHTRSIYSVIYSYTELRFRKHNEK